MFWLQQLRRIFQTLGRAVERRERLTAPRTRLAIEQLEAKVAAGALGLITPP